MQREIGVIGYKIRRIHKKSKSVAKPLRLFKKDFVFPTGAIHYVWDRVVDPTPGKLWEWESVVP